MTKRKITPLQKWRASYSYVSAAIRARKKMIKSGRIGYKTPGSEQKRLQFEREQAREMMMARKFAARLTAEQWARDNAGHIPNAVTPDERV